MRYLYLLLPAFIFICSNAHAQQLLKGRVLEDKTRVPLGGIRIENITNKKTAETDIAGKFSILANLNDMLVLKSFAYEADTVLVIALTNPEYFMLPRRNLLNEVDVTGQQVQGSFKVFDRDYHNQTVQYSMDKYGNYKGGLTFRVWSNKAQEKKQKKLNALTFKYRWEAIIDTAFGPKNISQLVPLKGEELDAFIFLYRPKPQLYSSNNFNLLEYVNVCYKKFMLLPKETRRVASLQGR